MHRQEGPRRIAHQSARAALSRQHDSICIIDALCEDAIINVLNQLIVGLGSARRCPPTELARAAPPELARHRADARAVIDIGAVLCTSKCFAAMINGNAELRREVLELRWRVAALNICRPPPRRGQCPRGNAPSMNKMRYPSHRRGAHSRGCALPIPMEGDALTLSAMEEGDAPTRALNGHAAPSTRRLRLWPVTFDVLFFEPVASGPCCWDYVAWTQRRIQARSEDEYWE